MGWTLTLDQCLHFLSQRKESKQCVRIPDYCDQPWTKNSHGCILYTICYRDSDDSTLKRKTGLLLHTMQSRAKLHF